MGDEFDKLAHGYATLSSRKSVAAKLRKIGTERDRLRAAYDNLKRITEDACANLTRERDSLRAEMKRLNHDVLRLMGERDEARKETTRMKRAVSRELHMQMDDVMHKHESDTRENRLVAECEERMRNETCLRAEVAVMRDALERICEPTGLPAKGSLSGAWEFRNEEECREAHAFIDAQVATNRREYDTNGVTASHAAPSEAPELPDVCRSCGHERSDHIYGDDDCMLHGCGCPSFDAEPLPPAVPSPTLCVLRSEYDAVVKRVEEEERLSNEWHRKAADRRRDADWLRRILSLALVYGLSECERLRAEKTELNAALYTYRGSAERVVRTAVEVERARIVSMVREQANGMRYQIAHTVGLTASSCDRLGGARDALDTLVRDIEAGK